MLNALLEEHEELEKRLETELLTEEESREIKKKKLRVKDSIASIRRKYELKYDYDQHGGGVEDFGYNGVKNASL
tara:strand:+ start:2932 stop:3153 length:222 start_codon:yes stop_codon:yes gene_type:complete